MQIGGQLYSKLLNSMEQIEHALLNAYDCDAIVQETIAISQQFCLNHQVSFDFLQSEKIAVEEKVRRLQKIYVLVTELKSANDEYQKAISAMSKHY